MKVCLSSKIYGFMQISSKTENLHINVILGSIFVLIKRIYIYIYIYIYIILLRESILGAVYEAAVVKLSETAL